VKVGDLVIRKIPPRSDVLRWGPALEQRQELGHGIILSKQMSGNPEHPCIDVFYTKVGKSYLIAESLMEVISESQ